MWKIVKHAIIFFLLLEFPTEFLNAQENELTINVYRNQILDDLVIIKMTGLDQNPNMSVEEVKRRLETRGLFSRVTVTKKNNVFNITVIEKTSWVVVPYLSLGSNSTVYGVAGGKSASFGQDNKFFARYQQGKKNKEAGFVLRDEYFQDTFWALGVGYEFEDSLHKIYYNRKTFEERNQKINGICPKIGYHIDPHIYVEVNTCLEYHSFENSEKISTSGNQVSNKFTGGWSNLYQQEGLTRGKSFKFYYETSNSYSDFHFDKVGAFSEASLFLEHDLNWIVRANAEIGDNLPFYQLFESNPQNLRAFNDQQFRDEHYFSIQNDLLLTSLPFWKMILRPILFVDSAYFQNEVRLGVGTGLHLYFKTIAMPALQLFVGYGFNPAGLTISLLLGPQF